MATLNIKWLANALRHCHCHEEENEEKDGNDGNDSNHDINDKYNKPALYLPKLSIDIKTVEIGLVLA